jgi:hypothetical protein
MSVMKLNSTGWKNFKKKHSLEKDPIVKKARLDGVLKKFQRAAADCQESPGEKSLMQAFSVVEKLKAIFKKLVKDAENSEIPAPAKQQLKEWKDELKMISSSLAKLYSKSKDGLKAQDQKNMDKTFDVMGL